MTDPARRDPDGPRPDDDSSIRPRSGDSIAPPRSTGAPSGSAGATRDRLDGKLRRGRAVLASLPAGDDRARLLHIAIVRRDEALLDGVLASLGMGGDSSPPSR